MKMTLPYRTALSDTGRWRHAGRARGGDRYDDRTRLFGADATGTDTADGPTRSSNTPQYQRRIARLSGSATATAVRG